MYRLPVSKESQIKKVRPTEDSLEKDNIPTYVNRYQHYENRFQDYFSKAIQDEWKNKRTKLQDTSFIQDAFIFCTMLVSIGINDTMV